MTNIDYLLFDLDDTLYTSETALFHNVGERIEAWVSQALDLPRAETHTLRKSYLEKYGTTMMGLLAHHPELDIDDYLDHVHDIDVSKHLGPDPALRAMLLSLPAHRVVFTNSIADWAERVLRQLEIRECFEDIIDVRATGYKGKPHPLAYERALTRLQTSGERCVLLDDRPDNLKGAARFGMRTILVRAGETATNGIDHAVDTVLEAEPLFKQWLCMR
jgi:putative hydrolase of the HAD superfamily